MGKVGLLVVAVLVCLPFTASAQATASITGVVKDASGAVLPGVTVEAASPALLERSRTVVTDSTGQFRIVTLPSGTYDVTFTLTGFNTVKREGVALAGSFVAVLAVDLRVGDLSETITVTGAAPLVDVQSTRGERTIDREVISAIPTARGFQNLAVLVPGVVNSGTQDVGGAAGDVQSDFTINGGNVADGRLKMNGVSIAPPERAGGNTSMFVANAGAAQEVVISTTGGLGEAETAGIVINVVARDGGNVFKGSIFGSGANSSMQSDNFSAELQAQGLRAGNRVQKVWDLSPSVGGPVVRDRMWFFLTGRHFGSRNYVAGMFYNKNAGNPNSWTYDPDLTRQAITDGTWKEEAVRLTFQATPRNKFSGYWGEQQRCATCIGGGSATTSPEAQGYGVTNPNRVMQANWTAPLSNRILAEAGAGTYQARWGARERKDIDVVGIVPTTEQCSAGCASNGNIAGLNYRAHNLANNWDLTFTTNGSLAYVTGAQSMKVGFIRTALERIPRAYNNAGNVTYRVNNGVPNQITELAYPLTSTTRINTFGLYVQDQWTMGRLTLQGALRYDHEGTSFPAQSLPASRFIPNAISFPATDGVSFHDVTPRMGAAYDVFGNGKTALKMTLGKYVIAQDGGTAPFTSPLNPISRLATSTTRTWNDANRNFVPDCDLTAVGANGECGGLANVNFGTANLNTSYDPDILTGWGVRPNNWELGVSVQHQLLQGLAVNLAYARRWFGNFLVTDNLATTNTDYTFYTLGVPNDPRLPNAGGTVQLFDVVPAKFGQVNNYVTNSSKYGKQSNHYDGVNFSANLRLAGGITFQGGGSAGRTTVDFCEVTAKIPEALAGANSISNGSSPFGTGGTLLPVGSCEASAFTVQGRFLGAYTIPKIDVLISGTMQALPGPVVAANWSASNALVAPALGRNLSGNAPNVTMNLISPGSLYADRINQVDFRVAKILRFGAKRAQISLDLYNATNSSVVQTYNNNFIPAGAWQTPTLILPPRLMKVSAQFDF